MLVCIFNNPTGCKVSPYSRLQWLKAIVTMLVIICSSCRFHVAVQHKAELISSLPNTELLLRNHTAGLAVKWLAPG